MKRIWVAMLFCAGLIPLIARANCPADLGAGSETAETGLPVAFSIRTVEDVEKARSTLNVHLDAVRGKVQDRLAQLSPREDASLALKPNGPLDPTISDEVIKIFTDFNRIAAQVAPPSGFAATREIVRESARGLLKFFSRKVPETAPTTREYLDNATANYPELDRTAAALRTAIKNVKDRKLMREQEIQALEEFINDLKAAQKRLFSARELIEEEMRRADPDLRQGIEIRLLGPLDLQIQNCAELVAAHQAFLVHKLTIQDKVDQGLDVIERDFLIGFPAIRYAAENIADSTQILQGTHAAGTLKELASRAILASSKAIGQVYKEVDESRGKLVFSSGAIKTSLADLNTTLRESRVKTERLAGDLRRNFADIAAEQERLTEFLENRERLLTMDMPQQLLLSKGGRVRR